MQHGNEQTSERSPFSGRPVVDWLEDDYHLRDSTGDELGDILEINPDFIVVEGGGGLLSSKQTWYVPRADIMREDGTDWYLGITRDEFEARDWSVPPAQSRFIEGSADYVEPQVREPRPVEGVEGKRHEGTRILRYEEDVEARAVGRQAGEYVVTKDVVEDKRTVEVPVRREEVRLERHPVSGEAATTGDVGGQEPFSGESIRVPVMEEEVEVRKVARPVEEVEVKRDSVEGVESVDTTVRREEIDVQEKRDRR
jgi:uncharacterized protein (TIGR02271 family)